MIRKNMCKARSCRTGLHVWGPRVLWRGWSALSEGREAGGDIGGELK